MKGLTALSKEIRFDHLPLKYWNLANVPIVAKAPPYDGHTSEDVLKRLLML